MRATLTALAGTTAGQLHVVPESGLVIGRGVEADVESDEPTVSRRHARVAHGPDGSFYIEDLGSANGTFLGDRRVTLATLAPGDRVQLGSAFCMRFAIVREQDASVQRRLYESSIRDVLTHAFNRRHLAERLRIEIGYAQRMDLDVAILMIDVDGLKALNDRYGHLAGDRALWAIAKRIQDVIRVEDLLARYGGDEFVVLAGGADPTGALELAERVRSAVARLHLGARGEDVSVTVSIGAAALSELEPTESVQPALLTLADTRLYDAKRAGRNRVRA